MISDGEDEGINSKVYRINKNSKKFRKQQKNQKMAETSEDFQANSGYDTVRMRRKHNTDLSDHNNFLGIERQDSSSSFKLTSPDRQREQFQS